MKAGSPSLIVTNQPIHTISTMSTHTNASVNPAAGFFEDLLIHLHLPRWAIYTIFGAGGLIILLCCFCICIKCCCKRKRRQQKDQQILLKGLDGRTATALVQPDMGDVDYGSAKQYRGKLLYSLGYNATLSELTVGIKQAVNLKAMDLGRSSDPYVKVYILPEKFKVFETKVFKNTLNPFFNEQFTFQLSKSTLQKSTAIMKVFDFNRFTKHEIIGELRVQLCNIDWNHVIEEWQDLAKPAKFEEESLGEICFSLCYVPTISKLTVVILEAKNLKSMDIGGSSDPYVKVQLALDKRKWKKRTTSIKKKSLNPYFNESFTFDVSLDQIQVGGEFLTQVEEFKYLGVLFTRKLISAPPHREEPVEVARASIPDASWTPSSGGVPGTSHREEAQGTAQDTLEGLCLSAGLGTPLSLLSLLPPRHGTG
ncbi:hypothetical protein CRENBAI_009193 [Crenichthys baileyi]|uniref:C2 domain-containing protein n=1 Tax=Crenichthys baileyi TaxID=28760 RepID=A0AAV9SKX6_9TELE